MRESHARILRYALERDVRYACISQHQILGIEGDPFGDFDVTEPVAEISEVEILPPCRPRTIVGVGWNYVSRITELDVAVPTEPRLFLKPPSSVIGTSDSILYPSMAEKIHGEGELLIVVGRRARDVTAREASQYILGYTWGNDVTACDFLRLGKFFDTFCPLGPCIATGLDPTDLRVRTRVNGHLAQDCSTKDMIFDVWEILSFSSRVMTLEPGDIVLTGSPAGAPDLERGDTVEVEIDGIGVLRNTVA